MPVLYTFSDMYVTGVMLMPMLFSTVCGKMVRNDLSAPIWRTLFTLPFSRREYAGEKYLVSIVPACVLAVVFALVVLAVSLDMGTDGLFAIITSAPAWALYGIGALLGAVALAVSVMVSLRALLTAQL